MTSFADPLTRTLAAFLEGIGIEVRAADVAASFLPGLRIEGGALLVDERRLAHPGDLLHEAGHLAVVPGAVRASLTDAVAVPGIDAMELETAVVPWSWAAALAAGVDPAVVFHAHGYDGKSEGLLRTFGFGVYPGVHLLEAAGLTATGARAEALGVAPYPHMLRWLRA